MHTSDWPKRRAAVVAVIFIITSPSPAGAVTACVYDEPTVWQTIERMSVDQVAGTLILVGLLTLLMAIALSRGRAIFRAVRQTRAYESRALTALFYNRAEEAVSVCALFPSSPVAAVVTASFQQSHSLPDLTPRCARPSKPAFQRAVVAQTIALKRWLWILAAITMTLGNVVALWQDNLQRILAYSSVAHAGYMLIGMTTVLSSLAPEIRRFSGISPDDPHIVEAYWKLIESLIFAGAFKRRSSKDIDG